MRRQIPYVLAELLDILMTAFFGEKGWPIRRRLWRVLAVLISIPFAVHLGESVRSAVLGTLFIFPILEILKRMLGEALRRLSPNESPPKAPHG